jgi:type IV fimbrial biogenesis protein FimT
MGNWVTVHGRSGTVGRLLEKCEVSIYRLPPHCTSGGVSLVIVAIRPSAACWRAGSRLGRTPAAAHIRAAARGAAGFSLIELLTVITIVGILLGIATSSYKYMTNSNRVSSEINGLLADLQFARSEAVRAGQPVSVCVANNSGTTCNGTAGAGASWQTGWIVFSDVNGDGSLTGGTDQPIRVQKAFSSSDTLVPSDTNIAYVTFNREGFATSIPSADTANGVTFKLNAQPASAQWERCLNINWAGIMATQRNATSPTTCN